MESLLNTWGRQGFIHPHEVLTEYSGLVRVPDKNASSQGTIVQLGANMEVVPGTTSNKETAVEDALVEALRSLENDNARVQSLTGFNLLVNNILIAT